MLQGSVYALGFQSFQKRQRHPGHQPGIAAKRAPAHHLVIRIVKHIRYRGKIQIKSQIPQIGGTITRPVSRASSGSPRLPRSAISPM